MTDVTADIDAMIARARKAQQSYEANGSQERFDRAAEAAAWALMEPSRNAELAAFAVAETGLGKIADKITKNHRKTLGLLRDIHGKTSFGLIDDDAQSGVSEFLRPKGVVAAIVPSTNPLATPINNVVNALKTGNAIILAPSPKGAAPLAKLLEYVYAEFDRIGLDHDLVQMVPNPPSKEKTARLMQGVDMLVVTGSQSNVRSAYSSGTPALGVGMGNVVTIIDETADLDDAAGKIARSKCFDNATSCSSENAVIVVDAVYDAFLQAIARAGGMCLDQDQTNHLISTHWHDGHLNRNMLAKDIDAVLDTLGFADAAPEGTKFLVAPAQPLARTRQFRVKKWRCSLRFTAHLILQQPRKWHAKFTPIRDAVIHWDCIVKMITVRANWPWICRPAVSSLIRRIALPLEGHSTMAFLSRCRWVVGHGVAIRLMII